MFSGPYRDNDRIVLPGFQLPHRGFVILFRDPVPNKPAAGLYRTQFNTRFYEGASHVQTLKSIPIQSNMDHHEVFGNLSIT